MPETASPATVLIVDDDAGVARLIEKSLRREGLEVAIATSGREAEQWLGRHRADLLLLDLKLQDMQGQELVRHLGGQGLRVPFVAITGQGDEQVAVEVMKQGAIDYLVKTAKFLELVPSVVQRSLKQILKERKLVEAEEALRREHQLTATILNTCGALIVALDREGRIRRFNHACERTTGYSFEEVRGKVFLDLFAPPDERAAEREVFERVLSGRDPVQHESPLMTKSGGRRLVAWSNGAPSAGDVDEGVKVIKTGIDITERKQLEAEILRISDYEKQRIGQDLHDGLGQHLTGIELMTEVLEQQLAKESKSGAARAFEIAEHVREAIHQTRMLARGLAPVTLESEGLMCGLQELALTTQSLFKVACSLRCDPPVLMEDKQAAMHLYRIAQEAVSNAIKHGKAKRIEIGLNETEGRINLAVHDDGTGFSKVPRTKGMGLRIMRYRAGMIGGSLVVQHGAAGGTTVVCSVHQGATRNTR